ncbi:MAG TPA: 50S ribosomal protein L25 [Candidatus Paceibacterota bacterium]|nr:50S ribosomal protein L25 [Candidatus Paceibacterota bacterium]
MLTLNVEKREKKAKLAEIRQNGKIPAVFYGRKSESTPIVVKEADFLKAWKEAGESSVLVLKGAGDEHEALIHDIDLDPVTGRVRHADFYILEKGKKVKVGVPIEFNGLPPAVKELGGTLVKVLHELEIEAMPKDLPHQIEVDVTGLVNFESRVLAKDVKLPQGVELVTDAEEVVALVSEVKEEIEEVVAPIDLESIEVEQKGKKEEEGEEGAGDAGAGSEPAK